MKLKNMVDMHIHGGPSLVPRKMMDHEIALEAANAGMSAVVLKSHDGSTVERAQIAQNVAGDRVKVFGGIALNSFVGGLNPMAVRAAIAMGGKIVWLPTFTAKNHLEYERRKNHLVSALSSVCQGIEGISVLDAHGSILPDVIEILEMIAKADIVLALGHVSVDEAKAVAAAAREKGVKKIILNHPDNPIVHVSLADQKWFAKQGVILERCIVDIIQGEVSWKTIVSEIQETGIERNIISTDLGQVNNPAPAAGMELAYDNLKKLGVCENDLVKLMSATPMKLLDIL
jgi:hypothetical protein